MSKNVLRAISFFAVLFMVLVLPWWLSFFLLLAIVIYVDFYLEVLFFGFIVDILYGVKVGFVYPALSLSLSLLLLVYFVKTQIRT